MTSKANVLSLGLQLWGNLDSQESHDFERLSFLNNLRSQINITHSNGSYRITLTCFHQHDEKHSYYANVVQQLSKKAFTHTSEQYCLSHL